MRTRFRVLLAAGAVVACGQRRQGQAAQGGDSTGSFVAAESQAGDDRDPCRLVSRAEAEQLIGPLYADPFRARGSEPAPDGTLCRYEAQSGRHIGIDVTWTDGAMAMRVMGIGSSLMDTVMRADSGQADSLRHGFDETRIMVGDHFMARKREVMVDVDYLGTGIGVPGAIRFAQFALGRVGQPLAYDGAAAARAVRWPRIAPRDACSLVDRADAEQVLGPLSGDPVSSAHQETCTYTLRQSRGPLAGQQVALQVTWRDGYAALENLHAMTGVVMQHTVPGGSAGFSGMMSQLAADSGMRKMMGAFQGVMKSQGVGVQLNDHGGLQTDTAVAGPWDYGALTGLSFLAVKTDVMVQVDLRAVQYPQAKALVTKAMERL